uniref:N-terminal phage integrase SAM-like domain-containing protein n=1 Tax=Phocaeicola sp. TaxID=2773926 RepID=UPI003AB1FDB6
KNRLKENTWLTKEHIIRTKILPYFGKLKISEISTKEIITWQNEMLAYINANIRMYRNDHLKMYKITL